MSAEAEPEGNHTHIKPTAARNGSTDLSTIQNSNSANWSCLRRFGRFGPEAAQPSGVDGASEQISRRNRSEDVPV